MTSGLISYGPFKECFSLTEKKGKRKWLSINIKKALRGFVLGWGPQYTISIREITDTVQEDRSKGNVSSLRAYPPPSNPLSSSSLLFQFIIIILLIIITVILLRFAFLWIRIPHTIFTSQD
ncbi:hypothetical protein VNO77_24351 [Canavalia gladiata]|uniref:Uncharacterized protein n=1 Tax=Canavalia gladiata TaxID=3824 RepID=A0AAN9L647_CANGL